jgi:hypothetical protein
MNVIRKFDELINSSRDENNLNLKEEVVIIYFVKNE